jgi:hypothetical protein
VARTIGMILSAVMVFVVSAIALLLGALAASGILLGLADHSPLARDQAAGYFLAIAAAAVFIGLGGWGIATGVGIIQASEWARISLLVFGAIFLVGPAFGSLAMILDPRAGVTYIEGAYLGSIRPEMAAFYGALAALGVFWLCFFSSKSVKARFSA